MDIDSFLPQFDFVEHHEKIVPGRVDKVYSIVKNIDFSESFLIKLLMCLRGYRIHSNQVLHGQTFMVLSEKSSQEVVLGLIARPWKLKGDILKIDSRDFVNFKIPGYAKMAWNFTFSPLQGNTLIATETRIKCTDKASKMKFSIYWFFIRPFSGLIRLEMLRLIHKKVSLENKLL